MIRILVLISFLLISNSQLWAYNWETRWEFLQTNSIALCSYINLPSGNHMVECPGYRSTMGMLQITELCQQSFGQDWRASGVVDTRFKGVVAYECKRPHLVLRGAQR